VLDAKISFDSNAEFRHPDFAALRDETEEDPMEVEAARHDLAYPAVDLVLTNTKEHTLARRIFLPQDYLERGRDVAAGIAASAEVTIRLVLDTGELNPAGFRLDLLPAPQP